MKKKRYKSSRNYKKLENTNDKLENMHNKILEFLRKDRAKLETTTFYISRKKKKKFLFTLVYLIFEFEKHFTSIFGGLNLISSMY